MKIDRADFELLAEPAVPGWVVRVTVHGDDFAPRAVPLGAQVGELVVEGIVTAPDHNSFTGYLGSEPADGEHLFAGYLDTDLTDTGIEYHRSVP
jgi:hypothetical protein